jgi:hypothetical protein
MRNAVALIAGLVAVFSTLPYIRDTLKGKTKPNIVTWLTWCLLNTITAFAAYAAHANQTAIFAGAAALCTGFVVIVGLKRGVKKYTTFDIVCQILALVGIILWRLTGQPAVAISINIAADCIGVLPTYRHSWRLPHEETWQSYAIGGVSAVLAIASIQVFNYVSLAYPVYIFLSDASLVWVILYRLDRYKPKTPH